MKISIIVAIAKNRAIGYRNQLLWHISEDLKHFKALTIDHTVIMGRKTFESLPKGALPRRRNIVISRTLTELQGCEVYSSLEKALAACVGEDEVFIIGGETVYRQALPLANQMYLTLIDAVPEQADAFFPEFDEDKWIQTKKEKHEGFSFVDYVLK